MNKIFGTAIILLFSFSLLSAQPIIEVEGGTTYNWGKVKPEDSPLKAEITIKNIGNEELVISKVRPTCGCTTAPLDKDSLSAGEETKLHISLRIGGNTGPIAKQIRIHSNDPKKSTEIITLKADVVRPISVSPKTFFQFKDMMVGSESHTALFLENTTPNNIIISPEEINPEELKVNIEKEYVLAPGEKFELIFTASPKAAGFFKANVVITTSDPNQSKLVIHGYGKVDESPIFNSN